ncbi:hypothetical protein SDC9_91256 [bioreactor metagenome]|uniref:HK97 gp10 family phage protein n=1 Tax=bioreactor metagenome TaxID=1076179 RepID=A0A644ZUZ0_9ZZZZ
MGTGGYSVIQPKDLQEAIAEKLREYGDLVYQATEKGLDKAEKVLINEMKKESPKKSKEFSKSWKGTGKKYKLIRFVGNTKTVRSKGRNIPLTNIFEYSTTNHQQPFIKKTFEKSIDKMAAAVVAEIKKEVE